MKTKIIAAIALGLIATSLITPASAQIYQWKDANGRTVVSDTPPPGSVAKKQRIGGSAPAPAAEPAATSAPAAPVAKSGPQGLSERDMEFKKRQQEQKEKADKAAKEEADKTARQENCDRARQALTTLESQQPVATVDEKGERQIMGESARQAEIERLRKIVADSCK